MAGPRIEGDYIPSGLEGYTRYNTYCCTDYGTAMFLKPDRAQDHLGEHLVHSHGIVKDPSTLHIQYKVPYKE